jgi:hypothetical protein
MRTRQRDIRWLVVVRNPALYGFPAVNPYTLTAAARANLATGELGVSFSSDAYTPGISLFVEGRFEDTLYFSGTPNSEGNYTVTLGATVTGSYTGDAEATFGINTSAGIVGGVALPPGGGTYTETFTVSASSPTLHLQALLNAYPWEPSYVGSADFMSTAALFIELPDGVTYESESGVFLSESSGGPWDFGP